MKPPLGEPPPFGDQNESRVRPAPPWAPSPPVDRLSVEPIGSLRTLFTYCKTVPGLVTLLVAVAPLIGIFVVPSFVPVWTPASYLAAALSVLAMAFAFFAMRDDAAESLKRRATWLVAVGTALIIAYICLNLLCIFEKDGARVVTGLWLTEDAVARIANGTAKSRARADLLASYGFEHAELAWKHLWLIDIMINLTFVIGWVFLSTGIFMSVLRSVSVAVEKGSAHNRARLI